MSFDFDLSSDEEDLEEWTRKNFQQDNHTESAAADSAVGSDNSGEEKKEAWSSTLFASKPSIGESSCDEEEIDWEDAPEDTWGALPDSSSADAKPAASETTTRALQPVMIDLGVKHAKKPFITKPVVSSKKRKRNKYRLESLPANVQDVLCNLHQSHLLTLTGSAVHRSRLVALDNAGDMMTETLLAAAHSLVPPQWALGNENETPSVQPDAATADTAASSSTPRPPTLATLKALFTWYTDLIHNVDTRRDRQFRRNRAAGAPPARPRRRGRAALKTRSPELTPELSQWEAMGTLNANYTGLESLSIASQQVQELLSYASFLSATHDENPQLLTEHNSTESLCSISRRDQQVVLLVAMARSLGWRTRYVQAMRPIKKDLDVDHPLVSTSTLSLFQSLLAAKPSKSRKKKAKADASKRVDNGESKPAAGVTAVPLRTPSYSEPVFGWVEILCRDPNQSNQRKLRWVHVDPVHQFLDQPDQVERCLARMTENAAAIDTDRDQGKDKSGRRRRVSQNGTRRETLAYATAVENAQSGRFRLTDVTPRYADSWIASLRLRGVVRGKKDAGAVDGLKDVWWSKSIERINRAQRPETDNQESPATAKQSGASQDDAIPLDDSDSDCDKKPAAIQLASSVDEIDQAETQELQESAGSEALPTSKAAFKSHPLYVIPSGLNSTEVLVPDASKRMCGVFKGELVYKRSDVSTLRPAKKWLYLGRKVLEANLSKPIKRVKARKKASANGSFQALQSYGVGSANDGSEQRRVQEIETAERPLEDGMDSLYAIWQTNAWSPPPVGPGNTIPVNEYRNVELELLNPGLVHIDRRGMAAVAKKLGIPYAPCLLGFEGHNGNRTPTIRGIVVHEHNEELLLEANVEVAGHALQEEHENRRKAIHLKWKKLLVGLLTKDRLEREYG